MKPGQAIEVEMRDIAADASPRVGKNRRAITIGTPDASKLMVEPS